MPPQRRDEDVDRDWPMPSAIIGCAVVLVVTVLCIGSLVVVGVVGSWLWRLMQ